MTTAKPPARYGAIGERASGRLCSTELHHIRGHDHKLAEAWQPLYKTLSPEQRQRMAALAVLVLRDMSDVVERRRAMTEDDDD